MNIKNYEEFMNEGLYDIMNQNLTNNNAFFSIVSFIVSIFVWIIVGIGSQDPDMHLTYPIWIATLLDIPLLFLSMIFLFKDPYHKLRSAILLGKSSKEYNRTLKLIDKYPDMKNPLSLIKLKMKNAIDNNDKREISECIHQIYNISKKLQKREKNNIYFDLTDEEKEILKNKLEKDPYNEESDM